MRLTFALFATSFAPALAIPLTCHSQTQPNPLTKHFPKDVTGVINGTTAIVPIPYAVARSIVPSEFPILTAAYEQVFPTLGNGMYPAVLEAVQDHDVGMPSFEIPDFTRVALKLPFVDRLNDGSSAFKYTPPQLISATNLVALLGSVIYGDTIAGTFDPPCDAYASSGPSETYMRAYTVVDSLLPNPKPVADLSFRTAASIPYTLEVFVNVLNQPIFGDGVPLCDNYITLLNTTVTTGQYAPVPVEGTLAVRPPLYPSEETFGHVYGYRMANAFVERNGVACESLKGYSGR
ncbi:hypothetical protein P171DRAFT_63901 [Karstenula rhodostoma CBS 690.94]|uniref:Uncharacterized protein n=1 Tax=Karstenula rhodostoma CBS 690.94 TaxID=1392251 RepID=A0A9P4UAL9_9PLEO|nr:hypothetical protein P171DRAFT_63901 [Karstenula rhodostoma CBS 690.94]